MRLRWTFFVTVVFALSACALSHRPIADAGSDLDGAEITSHESGTDGSDAQDIALDEGPCGDGGMFCHAACIDVQSDPMNCGTCDHACAAGEACMLGRCRCNVGRTLCSGVCVDLGNDPHNCGACGTSCDALSTCVHGACDCPAPNYGVCMGTGTPMCVNFQT